MAILKGQEYVWNESAQRWDKWNPRTYADLITETTTYKVMTATERSKIEDYLTNFNIAEKLVRLNSQGKIGAELIAGGLAYLPITGGTMQGNIHLGGYALTDVLSLLLDSGHKIQHNTNNGALEVVHLSGKKLTLGSTLLAMDNRRITEVSAPTSGSDAATKAYVDQLVAQGTHLIAAVRVASTSAGGNISPLSGLKTIDGVTLKEGDRVLLKDQTNATENGVYIASANAWTKSIHDSDEGSLVSVLEGTSQIRYQFHCKGNGVWDLYWIDDDYYAIAGGGLELAADGFGFQIKAGGVTNSMLAGSINQNKIAGFAVGSYYESYAELQTITSSGSLHSHIKSLTSAIKMLRGTAEYKTNNSETIAGAYSIANSKNKIMYGNTLPTSYEGTVGDVFLLIEAQSG